MTTLQYSVATIAADGITQTNVSTDLAMIEVVSVDVSAVTGVSATVTPQHVTSIRSAIIMPLGAGNEADLAGLDVTFVGNTIVLADGTGLDLSADLGIVHIMVIGHNR